MRVALFTTCLVDHLFPHAARCTDNLLRRLGFTPDIPPAQTCCGQPPFNDGFWDEARRLARGQLAALAGADAVVVPSGSCAAMIRHAYSLLFAGEPTMRDEVAALGARTFELSEFLLRRLGIDDVGATFRGRVTYLASCHGYRDLGLGLEPLRLLRAVRGLEYVPLDGTDECCGFGGVFSMKMPELSASMLDAKVTAILRTGAEVVTGTDVSCLMHVQGGLSRRGLSIRAMHLAEILAHQETAAASAGTPQPELR